MSIRRKLLLSHLTTAVTITAVVRVVADYAVTPQLQALPGGNLQARQILDDLGVVLLMAALILATATFFAFDRLVLRRVHRLTRQINSLAESDDPSQQIDAGTDEVSTLARPVTNLVGSLRATLVAQRQQISTSEHRLTLTLEATGDGLWDFEAGASVYCSDSYYDLLGYPRSSDVLQPDKWRTLIHEDDLSAVDAEMASVRAGTTDILAAEFRMRTASGTYKWVFLRGRVLAREDDGAVKRMIGTTQDIDARRRREQTLHENQELFRSAFEDSPVGMSLVAMDGSIIKVNRPLCRMVGYSEAELLGMRFQNLTHPDDLGTNLTLFHGIQSGERRHFAMEKRYICRDGSLVWVQIDVGVVADAAGRPKYTIGQLQNITDRKRNDDERHAYAQRLVRTKEKLERSTAELAAKTVEAQAAKAAAEQASRAKSVFLANISHEIRTPMAAILGFAELLRDHRLPNDERARCFETVSRNGQHLLALINDILDLSKIEAEKMTVERIPADPAAVLADVEAMTAAKAQHKHLAVTFHVATDVPKRIHTDPTRLRQVLLNLVSNAIKFTPAGKISVDMGWQDGGRLRVVITDTGLGMSPEQLARIFLPFHQADVSTTRRFGGTGLGLAICQRLVEMMGGSIAVSSTPGVGSRFEVLLDTPACDTMPAAVPPPAAVPALRPGLRVLLAEDGVDNQRLVSFYLMHAEIACEVAENGRTAVERVRTAAACGRPFDLVLMDMQMPEMDGYAATRAIRDAGHTLPIVALTAHGMDEAREQSLAAGCCDHLVKPIDHTVLIAAIATHTARSAAPHHRPLSSDLSADPRFQPLIEAYVAELPGQVARLLDLARTQQAEPLRRLVHQIKGAGGGYGLPTLSAAAADAEIAVARSEVQRLTENVDDLISLMRSVHGYDRALEAVHDSARIDH